MLCCPSDMGMFLQCVALWSEDRNEYQRRSGCVVYGLPYHNPWCGSEKAVALRAAGTNLRQRRLTTGTVGSPGRPEKEDARRCAALTSIPSRRQPAAERRQSGQFAREPRRKWLCSFRRLKFLRDGAVLYKDFNGQNTSMRTLMEVFAFLNVGPSGTLHSHSPYLTHAWDYGFPVGGGGGVKLPVPIVKGIGYSRQRTNLPAQFASPCRSGNTACFARCSNIAVHAMLLDLGAHPACVGHPAQATPIAQPPSLELTSVGSLGNCAKLSDRRRARRETRSTGRDQRGTSKTASIGAVKCETVGLEAGQLSRGGKGRSGEVVSNVSPAVLTLKLWRAMSKHDPECTSVRSNFGSVADNMSLHQASKEFSIPYGTLHNKFNGKHGYKPGIGIVFFPNSKNWLLLMSF
ncbi:hypothetical protein PR048_020394 [Dryococelus australis]|uniref:HTH psq-type domain-containing protein n=1 Tax=Dryococelus australis TaxID=614101 RepID=A0ABQ9H6E2_9NEOP|nr:hypothetical protein PR048_020394 [Dryococelus australis]